MFVRLIHAGECSFSSFHKIVTQQSISACGEDGVFRVLLYMIILPIKELDLENLNVWKVKRLSGRFPQISDVLSKC